MSSAPNSHGTAGSARNVMIFDPEDSVVPNRRRRARNRIVERSTSGNREHEYVVRVNARDIPLLLRPHGGSRQGPHR
jgi:citrate lyase beta subunit